MNTNQKQKSRSSNYFMAMISLEKLYFGTTTISMSFVKPLNGDVLEWRHLKWLHDVMLMMKPLADNLISKSKMMIFKILKSLQNLRSKFNGL